MMVAKNLHAEFKYVEKKLYSLNVLTFKHTLLFIATVVIPKKYFYCHNSQA